MTYDDDYDYVSTKDRIIFRKVGMIAPTTLLSPCFYSKSKLLRIVISCLKIFKSD